MAVREWTSAFCLTKKSLNVKITHLHQFQEMFVNIIIYTLMEMNALLHITTKLNVHLYSVPQNKVMIWAQIHLQNKMSSIYHRIFFIHWFFHEILTTNLFFKKQKIRHLMLGTLRNTKIIQQLCGHESHRTDLFTSCVCRQNHPL